MKTIISTLLLSSVSLCVAQGEPRAPNIVFIMADDLGYGELGCYGQEWIRTPHIDALAREGMRFTQHYSGQAVCAPARCTLMTGLHQGHAYIRGNGNPVERRRGERGWGEPKKLYFPGQHPIPADTVTIPELLKTRGYATGAMGKWGLGFEGSSGDPTKQGFDLFYGFLCQVHAHNHYPRFLWRNGEKEMLEGNDRTLNGETYSQDRFVDVACDFIREHKEDPFFLYLPFAVPHLSIQVPPASVAQYRDRIEEADYKHRGYLEHPHPRAGYAAMVSHMDAGIGQVVDVIDQLGLTKDTIIVFTSDNGPTFDRLGGSDSDFFDSSAGLRGRKGRLWEGGIRVPLVVRWPGKVQAGSESDLPCAFWDWLPTLADLGGVASSVRPDGIDGISFAPTLLGKAAEQQRHEFLYWEFSSYGGQQAVRSGRWKAIRYDMLKKNNQTPLRTYLFDLDADPNETTDVAADHLDVVRRLERIMKEQHEPSALFPFRPLDG